MALHSLEEPTMRSARSLVLLVLVTAAAGCGGGSPAKVKGGSYTLSSVFPTDLMATFAGSTLVINDDETGGTVTLPDASTVDITLAPAPKDRWPLGCGGETGGGTRQQLFTVSPSPLRLSGATMSSPVLHASCENDGVVLRQDPPGGAAPSLRFAPAE